MLGVADQQLKAFILDTEVISKKEMEAAEAAALKAKHPLWDELLARRLISELELRKLEAYILGIPFVDLEKEKIDAEVLHIIPEPIARKHNIVAFRKRGNNLEVAMIDPKDLETIEFIKKKSNLKILPRLTTPEAIKQVLLQYQKSLEAEFGDIIKKETEGLSFVPGVGMEEERVAADDLKKIATDIPIIRIVDTLIRHAILQKASDIHIEPTEKEVIVRYRIDGILHDAMVLPKNIATGIVARIKVLANLRLDERRLPQDGRFKVETPEYKFSFRVSVLPVYDGEKIAMRLLAETSQGLTLEVLGLQEEAVDLLHRAMKRPTGMILVTGPTGSGKTTTLYTVLDLLNNPGVNISTVEDPIEYRMPRINQTQVRPDIGLSFANGLRTLLRQDPNIIMVGEIRDTETANLAVNAALTGHLVLSTLHTNSAAGALPRLLDMQVEPFLIASTVNLIIAQRLVRRLCVPSESYKMNGDQERALRKQVNLDRLLELFKKEGLIKDKSGWQSLAWLRPQEGVDCPDGYGGRVGLYELLPMTETIRTLIMKNSTADEIQRQAVLEGMLTMLEDGFIKALQGQTSVEEVLRVTSEE